MIVLGFDTATAASAVAISAGGRVRGELRDDPAPGAHPGHATRLLHMAHALLTETGVAWRELDRIAAGVGPGAFTGLRVGVATARGLAASLSAELVGVSSLQALATPALSSAAATGEPSMRVLSVIDARRGEAFACAYERSGESAPRALGEPAAFAPEDLGAVIERAHAGGAAARGAWLAVGDGAVRFRASLEAVGVEVPPDADALHRVRAGDILSLIHI